MISKALFDELIYETLNESVAPWYRTWMEKNKSKNQSSSFYADAVKQTEVFLKDFTITTPLVKNVIQLLSFDILILPSPNYTAESMRTAEGGGMIILHNGFLSLLSFYLDFIFTLKLFEEKRIEFSDDELYNLGIAHRPNIENISQLSLAITYNYLNKPFQLPVLKTRPTGTEDMSVYGMQLICTELFVILHESAHLELGHHQGDMGGLSIITEFMLDEMSSMRKTMELEADLHAIRQVEPSQRPFIIRGAFIFLNMYGMYENFTGNKSNAHPHAINRIQNILTDCSESLDPSLVKIGKSSIETLKQDWEGVKSLKDDKNARLDLLLGGKSVDQAVWVLDLLTSCIAKKNKPSHSTVEGTYEA